MINLDEEALICDFAETYNIYNMRGLPCDYVAILAVGLRENSRIKMKMSDRNVPMEQLLMASMVDRLSILVWKDTKDGQKGRNKPKSILETMLRGNNNEGKYKTFNSIEDFEKARASIIGDK